MSATASERRAELRRVEPFWQAQIAVLAALVLYVTLPDKLTLGPSWMMPVLEGLLLVGLAISTPYRLADESPWRRRFAVALIGIVSALNAVALILLVHYLLRGGKTNGHELILAGVEIWTTNALVFGLWFWEIDGGGPGARMLPRPPAREFLFPQMTGPGIGPPDWRPGFVDYLYLSFTNATAFSPTDTMPLTPRVKLLMLGQSLVSLTTLGLVVSRAVNILS